MNLDALLGLDEPKDPTIPPPRSGAPPTGAVDLRALMDGSGGNSPMMAEEEKEYEPQRYLYHIHGQGRVVLWQWNWLGELLRKFLIPTARWKRLQRELVIDRIPFETDQQGQVVLITTTGEKISPSGAKGYGWYVVPPRVEVERYTIRIPEEPGNLPLRDRPASLVEVLVTDLPLEDHILAHYKPTREEARRQDNPFLRTVYMDMTVEGLVVGQIPRLQLRGFESDDRNIYGMQAERVSIEAGVFEVRVR